MATSADIAELRRMIGEPENVEPYTDQDLGAVIDGTASLNAAASGIWEAKAATYAELVNISEGGSSRANSALYAQSLAMADRFKHDDLPTTYNKRPTRTRAIERA